ncbi:GNAT family N-acetyltransferase [Streptomyces lancefieldiae]|uniref:GNAT family N-acetyltransferase n=1 Tax=Streptomyces lancefieldiae TaxID=3075520 RepID=A0ABU3AKL0_9ACTN|nr:GNAT family N-acetyltransferase [Streptomyces sp. DSM 40712]MDT0610410.1 GNAT family N-acetyltransferase [Streptomyces sp. DSM 40712]
MIRWAVAADLPVLQAIERAAGRPFREIDMVRVADDEPPSLETLETYVQDHRAWVWVGEAGRPVAYVIVDVIDGNAHIEQVSVHPSHARRGIGKALIEGVAQWARDKGCPALTLTTFTGVVWNGPYYERLGFRYLPEAEWTDGVRSLRAAEAAHGLDEWPRGCMRRDL